MFNCDRSDYPSVKIIMSVLAILNASVLVSTIIRRSVSGEEVSCCGCVEFEVLWIYAERSALNAGV
jgi:hypothetical protein